MSTEFADRKNVSPYPAITFAQTKHSARELTPVFSISSAHRCALAQFTFPPNPFIFCGLLTFSDDYRGWGCPVFLAKRLPQNCPRFRKNPVSKPFIFNPLQKSAQLIENMHFQVPLFSYSCALFCWKSCIFNNITKTYRGVYPKLSDFGISLPLATNHSPLATIFFLPARGCEWSERDELAVTATTRR